jgi:type VII secretion integral membrane protein EccD
VAAAVASVSGAGVATAAAVTVTVALAFLPALPMLAYRLGRLPMPSLPSDADQLRQDDEPVDAALVLGLADRVDDYLAALLTALSAIGGVSAVAVCTGGVPGVALSTVLGLLFLARARWFGQRKQRLPLLVAGVVALSAAAVTFAVEHPGARLLLAVAAAVVVAGASLGFALAAGRRPSSPLWGRALDMFEVVLILAVIPLALWVADLYSWIRSIRG